MKNVISSRFEWVRGCLVIQKIWRFKRFGIKLVLMRFTVRVEDDNKMTWISIQTIQILSYHYLKSNKYVCKTIHLLINSHMMDAGLGGGGFSVFTVEVVTCISKAVSFPMSVNQKQCACPWAARCILTDGGPVALVIGLLTGGTLSPPSQVN
jgi:hypothetical protein